MFNYDGEDTSLADMYNDVSGTAGKYTPLKNGKLLKIIIFIGTTSASSLVQAVRVELTNANWTPNKQMFMVNGNGLQTVPALDQPPMEYVIDQPVTTNSAISGQLIHVGGASPVTSNVFVFGVFQA